MCLLFSVPQWLLTDAAVGGTVGAGGALLSKVPAGMKWMYEGHLAKQASRQAFLGGKYTGQLEQLLKQDTKQLQKSIKSFDKNIKEHKQWIKDPTIKCKNWHEMRLEHQKALLDHWKKDAQRARNYKTMAKQVLKDKIKQEATLEYMESKHVP